MESASMREVIFSDTIHKREREKKKNTYKLYSKRALQCCVKETKRKEFNSHAICLNVISFDKHLR